jgi:hypothetical protein
MERGLKAFVGIVEEFILRAKKLKSIIPELQEEKSNKWIGLPRLFSAVRSDSTPLCGF